MKKIRDEEFLRRYTNFIYHQMKLDQLVVFTDGSADNLDTSLPTCQGYVIFKGGVLIESGTTYCNDPLNTSIKSELLAMATALESCKRMGYSGRVFVLNDCEFAIDYGIRKKAWESKSPDKPYYSAWESLRKAMSTFRDVDGAWIPRELNTLTDDLSKGMDISLQPGQYYEGYNPEDLHIYSRNDLPEEHFTPQLSMF